MRSRTFISVLLCLVLLPDAAPAAGDGAAQILQRYAEAWRGSRKMPVDEPVVVALAVAGPGGGEFSVLLPPDGPGTVSEGAPDDFRLGFETDIEFLRRLDRGEISALTAMSQARASDPIPLRLKVPDGFRWTAASRDSLLPLAFHFWNREWPETIRFDETVSRGVQSANAVVFYYQAGLRSAWYQIGPGMHVNPEPDDQTNPVRALLIVTRGAFSARLDGKPMRLSECEAVLIPAGMTHEFWSEGEQSGEAVMVMFGEGA